jgi:hypothetical protein
MKIEHDSNNAPASGEEQMQNGNVVAGSGFQTDSTAYQNQVEQGTNPAKREPYDGKKKLAQTKADSMATINTCNGQIGRVDLRAVFLIKSHHAAKSEFSESSDFEARLNIVMANKKIVSEMSDLKRYQSELESRKTELLKAAEDEVNEYSFVELSW